MSEESGVRFVSSDAAVAAALQRVAVSHRDSHLAVDRSDGTGRSLQSTESRQ